MVKIDERRYTAEENMTFVHKKNGTRMGNRICLGSKDSIDNYTEEPMTQEEIERVQKEKEERENRLNRYRDEIEKHMTKRG